VCNKPFEAWRLGDGRMRCLDVLEDGPKHVQCPE
jgi:hypothetical protein